MNFSDRSRPAEKAHSRPACPNGGQARIHKVKKVNKIRAKANSDRLGMRAAFTGRNDCRKK
jgi:hypothetical protein